MRVRTVGVEEELLIVDPETGGPRAVADQILRAADPGDDGGLEHELQRQQLEAESAPHASMGDLEDDLRGRRAQLDAAARRDGTRVVAAGTCPTPVDPELVTDPRYQRMAEHVGLLAAEQLACACHVHVAVDSEEEAVGALDRLRGWLPSLLAVSANSPFWQGVDTGYGSYRSQLMARWPGAGPVDVHGSAARYREVVAAMIDTGVVLDEAMIYFDARVSSRYPTVEIRIADSCADVRDAVVIASLVRALVDTAARSWKAGEPADPTPTGLLRLASWRAGRSGVTGDLLEPGTSRPRPAADVLWSLVDHVRPALRDHGDEERVVRGIERVLELRTGAARQRSVFAKTGSLGDVVADLARVTAGQVDD